jgi:hypothetical protein
METSELLRLRLLSQQQALNAAISSLRAVTATKAAGAATCAEPHAPLEQAGDNDTGRTNGLVPAPNPSTPSNPAPVITAAPTQKEFDDLKHALADGLKNVEDMKKKLASTLSLASTLDDVSAAALLRAEAAEGQLADLQKQNAALKNELATASQKDDIPMKTSTNNEIFTVIYYRRLFFPLLYFHQLHLIQKLRVEAAD